jgi:hypothetical protein
MGGVRVWTGGEVGVLGVRWGGGRWCLQKHLGGGGFAKQHQLLLRVEINFSLRAYLQTM